jgi:hypothetical protein
MTIRRLDCDNLVTICSKPKTAVTLTRPAATLSLQTRPTGEGRMRAFS